MWDSLETRVKSFLGGLHEQGLPGCVILCAQCGRGAHPRLPLGLVHSSTNRWRAAEDKDVNQLSNWDKGADW